MQGGLLFNRGSVRQDPVKQVYMVVAQGRCSLPSPPPSFFLVTPSTQKAG